MNKITADHLARRACIYIRQSTPDQVRHNLESQRRQYGLVLAGRDFPILFRELKIGKPESWLIQNSALGKVVVNGASTKQVEFEFARWSAEFLAGIAAAVTERPAGAHLIEPRCRYRPTGAVEQLRQDRKPLGRAVDRPAASRHHKKATGPLRGFVHPGHRSSFVGRE